MFWMGVSPVAKAFSGDSQPGHYPHERSNSANDQ